MFPTIKLLNDQEILRIDQGSKALLMEIGTHVPNEEALELNYF